ncbi:MAG: hypothetical protein IPP03_20385 [Dechloromonas sp.]|nr:hypothetical protein [Candidatus Dechloromonas phosphoritropha]
MDGKTGTGREIDINLDGLPGHRPEAAVRQARQDFELVVGRFGGLKDRNKDGDHRRHDQLSEENHVDS